MTGPTKSGKSVLCRAVLGKRPSVWLHGGQIVDEADFWSQAADRLSVPSEQSQAIEGSGSVGLAAGPVTVGGNASKGSTSTILRNNKTSVLRFCLANEITLVVDDFHYLDAKIQKRIIEALKSEIFNGLKAILIAVPHRAFDVVVVQKEMEGRFANIEIPRWSEQDLCKIATLGFPALNATVEPGLGETLSKESYGSPLLMQRFCLKVCQVTGVTERRVSSQKVLVTQEQLDEIYLSVAQQFGFPTYKKLSEGPQSRSDRIERYYRDGSRAVDIYQAVLMAVAMTGPSARIHYNDIRDNLKALLRDGDVPQKHEVSSALRNMTKIAKEKIAGEPVLEWMDDTLYLTDPLLMFYMRWAQPG